MPLKQLAKESEKKYHTARQENEALQATMNLINMVVTMDYETINLPGAEIKLTPPGTAAIRDFES